MKYIYILIISSLLISCSTNNSLKSIDAVGDHVYEHMTNADNISYNEYLSSFISPEEILEFIGECKYKEYIQEESADIKEWNLASGLDEDVYNKLRGKIKKEKEYGITRELHDFKVSNSQKQGGITFYQAELDINYIYPQGGSDDDRAVRVAFIKTNHEEFYVMGYGRINLEAGEPVNGY